MTSTPSTDTHTTGAEVGSLIDQALRPLRAVSEELHRRAVDYIVYDAGPELLVEIGSHRQDANALLCPGIADTDLPYIDRTDRRRSRLQAVGITLDITLDKGDAAIWPVWVLRDALYRCEHVRAEQWVRLGRLLQEVRAADWRVRRGSAVAGVPEWFDALLADVLRTAGTAQTADRAERAALVSEARSTWTPAHLAEVLAAGGEAGDETLFLALFHDGAKYGWRMWPATLPGVGEWLVEHARDVPARALGRLTVASRLGVIEYLRAGVVQQGVGNDLAALLSVDTSKRVRQEAVAFLAEVDPEERNAVLAPVLSTVQVSRATELVEYLAVAPQGSTALEAAVAANPRLAPVVEQRLVRNETVTAGPSPEPLAVPPMVPLELGPSAAPAKAELRRAFDRIIADLETDTGGRAGREPEPVRLITDADLDDFVAAADGLDPASRMVLRHYNVRFLLNTAPSLTLTHALRLTRHEDRPQVAWIVRRYLEPDADLRPVAELMERLGMHADDELESLAWSYFDVEASWPWWAEHLDRLRARLNVLHEVPHALEILGAFPTVPADILPDVAGIAVGSSKVNRPLAQAVLSSHPSACELAGQALADRSAEVRASAAAWLGSLDAPAAVPVLRAALGTEKREVVRAAVLTALRACGDGIEDLISPEALGAEAARGLRAKLPASLDWFGWEALPAVRWAGGGPVDPQVIRWWVVLADKMKNPDGRGLIGLYMSQLEPADAAVLASHVVRSWVVQDTRHPDQADSRVHADVWGRRAWQQAQDQVARLRADPELAPWLPDAEQEAAVPVEEQVARAYAKHQATYLGSAIADKGLVAFAVAMDGTELAGLVRGYMRANPGRRAQFEVLVHSLYANGRPESLQLLLSVARRHRMEALRATAAGLAADVAAERGWSAEELADRTIPTAGFSADGLLHLSYGSREFTGRLTPAFAIVLVDAEGKIRKSLPAARAGEDPEVVKAAKKQLTSARKEAKAVLTLQTERLYEAMCVQRSWTGADWRELLADHPLAGQLVTRLVWLAAPADGGRSITFRPTEDGELLGPGDDTVELAEDATVTVAHGTFMSPQARDAWRTHLADYEVDPLFDQLSASIPANTEGRTELDDLQGHMTDTPALHRVATKRGYTRGAVEDGGWFYEYVKPFASQGLTAVLTFTGSLLLEENIACATQTLEFRARRGAVPLDQVPPVLLAECYADYTALAALGPYDPNWRDASAY